MPAFQPFPFQRVEREGHLGRPRLLEYDILRIVRSRLVRPIAGRIVINDRGNSNDKIMYTFAFSNFPIETPR